MAFLTVIDGPLKGEKFDLQSGVTRIGRREGNDWVVNDGSVSGTHCEIEINDSGILLRDLGSTNGTKVNNELVKECFIYRNDIFFVGEVPMMIDGDDVPQNSNPQGSMESIPRTTIVIQPNRNVETPKEFGKKHSSNKVWVGIIVVLLVAVAALAAKYILG